MVGQGRIINMIYLRNSKIARLFQNELIAIDSILSKQIKLTINNC